jgi:hypothetical protein
MQAAALAHKFGGRLRGLSNGDRFGRFIRWSLQRDQSGAGTAKTSSRASAELGSVHSKFRPLLRTFYFEFKIPVRLAALIFR